MTKRNIKCLTIKNHFMKTIYKTTCARLMTLLVLALLSVSNVWGEDYTLFKGTSIETGDYILVGFQSSSSKYYAMNNTCTNNQYMGITEVVPSNDKISIDNPAIVWTISASENGYYIINGSNYLDDNASSSNNYVRIISNAASTSEWSFECSNNLWTITNVGNTSAKKTLSFNIGSSRVACYKAIQSGNTCVYLYKKQEAPAYNITAQSNNNTYGTVSLNGSKITAAPNAGYRYATPAYTVTSGTATVEQNGNEFIVTPSTDCTVQINFEAIPKHTVKWSVNGETSSDEVAEGATITFPANPSVDDVEFIGWAKAEISGIQDDKPTLVNTSTETMGEADVTYYAVFATAEVGNEYTQITSINALEAGGRYLIVGNSSSTYQALPVDKAETLTTVTPSSSKITNPADELVWTLEGTADQWKIKSVSNGKYLQISGGNLTFETSTELIWKASVTSSKFTWTSSATSGNKILSYYASGKKFNAYTSANTVYMYKANVTYSDYCTTVVPLVKHTLTISEVANGTLTVKKGNTILTSGKQVAEGAVVTLIPAPAAHYHFNAWTGDVEVSENAGVYTFTMPTSDATIGVTFAEDAKYHITANAPEGGIYTVKVGDAAPVTIKGENDGFDVYEGVTITMTSTADDTHKVHSTPFIVEYNDGTEIKKSSFDMPTQAVTITAQFVNTYSITAGTCENGSVSTIADRDGNAITRNSSGSKVVVSATPNEHYHLTGMYYVKDGEDKHNAITATDNVYSFSMVASNITVYAEFEEDDYVSITWSVNGATDVIEASKVYVGEPIVFPTDLADVSGKKFVGWVSEAYSNATTAPTYANATTVTATENATYYAVLADCEGTSTDYSYTITTSTSPYNVNGYKNGEQTITATCPTDNSKTFVVTYQIANFGEVSGYLQMKKNGEGYMYNTTNLGSITSVTIEDGSNLTTYYGTLENPKSGTEVGTGKGYFRIVAGSSAGTCSSITVNFTVGSYTYSNYCTSIANMTITSAKWATFCAPFDVTIPDDVKAYTAKEVAGEIAFEEVETTIPAGTPVVVYSEEPVNKDFAEAASVTDNTCSVGALIGTFVETTIDLTTGDKQNYVLQNQGGTVGFYQVAEFSNKTIKANRCYMSTDVSTDAGVKGFVLDDIVTGISQILSNSNKAAEGIYDLNGNRLAAPQKGINIINGVKVLVK